MTAALLNIIFFLALVSFACTASTGNLNGSHKLKTTTETWKEQVAYTPNFIETKAKSKTETTITQAPAPAQATSTTNSSTKTIAYDFYSGKVNNCNVQNCFPDNGVCIETNLCKCMKGYANYPEDTPKKCSYIQKKQLVAFLLEFFLPFGVGHFYGGIWWLGLIKLLLLVVSPIVLCITYCCAKNIVLWYILSIAIPLLDFVWWLVDAILFGINYYKDSNGVPLQAW